MSYDRNSTAVTEPQGQESAADQILEEAIRRRAEEEKQQAEAVANAQAAASGATDSHPLPLPAPHPLPLPAPHPLPLPAPRPLPLPAPRPLPLPAPHPLPLPAPHPLPLPAPRPLPLPSTAPPAPASATQATTQTQAGTQPVAPTVKQPASVPHPETPVPVAKTEEKPTYPGSIFEYDNSLNVCYLDSPEVGVLPVSLEPVPKAVDPAQRYILKLRIRSDGRTPEAPDFIEATFSCPAGFRALDRGRKIQFLVDGIYTTANEIEGTDEDGSPAAAEKLDKITFRLLPQQAKSIFNGNHVNLMIGGNEYRFEPLGVALFRKYLIDVDRLPPPAFSLARSCSKLIARLPTIITAISTTCEYIILGGFGLLFFTVMAAISMAVARPLKMVTGKRGAAVFRKLRMRNVLPATPPVGLLSHEWRDVTGLQSLPL